MPILPVLTNCDIGFAPRQSFDARFRPYHRTRLSR